MVSHTYVYRGVSLSFDSPCADELAAAIHTLDTLLQLQPQGQAQNGQQLWSLEATAMLASLRVHPRPGVDTAQERTRARELYDRVSKALDLPDYPNNMDRTRNSQPLSRTARRIAEDIGVHTEIARLWQGENLDRVGRALREALRLSELSGNANDPRLLNNLGVLAHFEENLVGAREHYERALINASGLGTDAGEVTAASILFNLARVYEDQGDKSLARDAYDKLLTRHPEYADGRLFTRYSRAASLTC
jgi:RNA polymerase-associated protein CTR9